MYVRTSEVNMSYSPRLQPIVMYNHPLPLQTRSVYRSRLHGNPRDSSTIKGVSNSVFIKTASGSNRARREVNCQHQTCKHTDVSL